MSDWTLKLSNIYASYGKREVLCDVSIRIEPGEIVGVLGENGTGKSTLLRLIAGLMKPLAGRIHIHGQDVTDLDSRRRRNLGVGYLMQGGRVFPNLSVQENYLLAKRHRSKLSQFEDSALGSLFPILTNIREKRAGLLSGGERQMLAIEMASQNCAVLGLWDEPTAGLSRDMADVTLDYIVRSSKRQMANLIVEQRAELLAGKVTRIIQMEELMIGASGI